MSLTLQEQLAGISKEIFRENININSNKHINIIGEIKKDESIHSDINKHVNETMNKTNYNIKKGQRREIWYVNFGQRKGSLQSGVRPCLIGSNPINNEHSNIRNVYPITSKLNKSRIPVHVELDQSCGLQEKSLVLIEQITTIDIRYDLLYYVGKIDEDKMIQVDRARNIQLGDLKPKSPLEKLPHSIQIMINEKLEDIKSVERTITNIKRESLVKHLMDERESYLISLQRICDKYNIDYKDYYVIYKKEDERIVV